jgi:hypothetical protein
MPKNRQKENKGNNLMKNSAILLLIVTVMIATVSVSAVGQWMDAAATMAVTDKNGDERIDREE